MFGIIDVMFIFIAFCSVSEALIDTPENVEALTHCMRKSQQLRFTSDALACPFKKRTFYVNHTAPIHGLDFHGQEFEDRYIFSHFLNDNTRKCHDFPPYLFESGAYQAVTWSNTFFFEKHYNFSTLLVEASPRNWPLKELSSRLNAVAHHAALCPVGQSHVCLTMERYNAMNKISPNNACSPHIPCFDFDDGQKYAFVSLDIEGFEYDFLKDRNLQADIVLVEVAQWLRPHQPDTFNPGKMMKTFQWFEDHDYWLFENNVGVRNMLWVSDDLVKDCNFVRIS